MPIKKRAKKTSVKTSVGSFVFCKFCVLAALFGAISAILFFVSLVQIPLSPPKRLLACGRKRKRLQKRQPFFFFSFCSAVVSLRLRENEMT